MNKKVLAILLMASLLGCVVQNSTFANKIRKYKNVEIIVVNDGTKDKSNFGANAILAVSIAAARAAATRERATRKERVGSELGHEDGVKEEGLSLRLMSVWSVILWDPLGTIGNPWVWKAI